MPRDQHTPTVHVVDKNTDSFYERGGQCCRVQVSWANSKVVSRGMVFGGVVSQIVFPTAPLYCKVPLAYSVLYPVKPHVHGLGAPDVAALVRKALCSGVVGGDGCWLGLVASQF